jgi:putative transposase
MWVMHRTTSLLLQPTVRQSRELDRLLTSQRSLYNAALEERRGAWRWERRAVTRYEQYRSLTGWDDPVLRFGIVAARGTLLRLDRAFQAFFRRCKAGETPGFPRFKNASRFNSVEYPDENGWRVKDGRLRVHGVGELKFRTSKRGVRGTPKTLVLRREGQRWRASVVCEVERPDPLPATSSAVGIDLGIASLLTTSDGAHIENPRPLRQGKERLARAQQLVAGRKRGSGRRRKAGAQVGALYRKMARQRRDHHHKVSRALVNTYGLIAHEDLKITNMTRRPTPLPDKEGGFLPNGAAAKGGLNKSIYDAGWDQLLRMLTYKAEEAGRELIAVDPRHTSQACSKCGHVAAENRVSQAKFRCLSCGYAEHADVNAARNILGRGQRLRPAREATEEGTALTRGDGTVQGPAVAHQLTSNTPWARAAPSP